jgi:hypothetical protein
VTTGLAQGFGISAMGIVTRGIGMVTDAIGDSIKAASDQAEAISKVTMVFGEQSREIEDWASTAAHAMGMSKTAALSAAGSLGNLFDGMGLAEEAGRDMSKAIVQLASDLGSFNNVSNDEALVALQAGLVGETEPMRRFGVVLSAAAVEAEVLASGMAKTKAGITEAMKVQARYNIIMDKTVNAQGDFQRTSDGLAGSQKKLTASFEDMQVQVGKTLQQAIMPFIAALVDIANQTPNTSTAVGKLTQQYRDLIRAQEFANETAQEGGTIFDQAGKAIYAFVSPQDKAIHDFTGTLGMHAKVLGVSRKELALYTEAGLTYGDSLETIRANLDALVQADLWTRIQPLADVVRTAFHGMFKAAESTGERIRRIMPRDILRAFKGSLTTMAQMMDPWREAWKRTKEFALDPFSPAGFEKRLERFARRAVRNAREAAEDGQDDVARAWRRLAAAARNPVVRAMVALGASVEQAIAVMRGVRRTARVTARIVDQVIGAVFPNGDRNSGGIDANHAGTPHYRGGWSWVGEKGPELMRLPSGTAIKSNQQSAAMVGGGGGNVTVNIYAHPTNDPVSLAREVTKALNAYRNAGGGPALKAAVGGL